jgi:hypothetical protein
LTSQCGRQAECCREEWVCESRRRDFHADSLLGVVLPACVDSLSRGFCSKAVPQVLTSLCVVAFCLLLQVADLSLFDVERSISLVPPDGEFALANYRTSHGIRPPFRLSVGTEPDAASDHKVCTHVWCRQAGMGSTG